MTVKLDDITDSYRVGDRDSGADIAALSAAYDLPDGVVRNRRLQNV